MTRAKRYVPNGGRSGIAAVELVMLLPCVAALMVLLFYVGHAGSDQLELAQDVHYKAWRVRYDKQPDDITPFSYVKTEQGQIEDEKEGKVKSGLIYDKWNHDTKSEAQFYANPWNAQSEWKDEELWPDAFEHSEEGKPSLSDEVLENNNQRIFKFQKDGKTYWSNLPYYEDAYATPIRNSDYVDPNTGNGEKYRTDKEKREKEEQARKEKEERERKEKEERERKEKEERERKEKEERERKEKEERERKEKEERERKEKEEQENKKPFSIDRKNMIVTTSDGNVYHLNRLSDLDRLMGNNSWQKWHVDLRRELNNDAEFAKIPKQELRQLYCNNAQYVQINGVWYRRMPPEKSIYHGEDCQKFVEVTQDVVTVDGKIIRGTGNLGSREFVINKYGELETSEEYRGTFNYVDESNSSAGHIRLDMVPYWQGGNSTEDKTPMIDRVYPLSEGLRQLLNLGDIPGFCEEVQRDPRGLYYYAPNGSRSW